MSQEKMSKKKKEELLKQQQKQKKIAILLIALVVAACAGGIGWTVYDNYKTEQADKEAKKQLEEEQKVSKENTNSETVNVDSLLDYLSGLDTELLNEEIAPELEETTSAAVSD